MDHPMGHHFSEAARELANQNAMVYPGVDERRRVVFVDDHV